MLPAIGASFIRKGLGRFCISESSRPKKGENGEMRITDRCIIVKVSKTKLKNRKNREPGEKFFVRPYGAGKRPP